MTFGLHMNCDNDAFEDERLRDEIARILRQLANRIADGSELTGPLHDDNGNSVGRWVIAA